MALNGHKGDDTTLDDAKPFAAIRLGMGSGFQMIDRKDTGMALLPTVTLTGIQQQEDAEHPRSSCRAWWQREIAGRWWYRFQALMQRG